MTLRIKKIAVLEGFLFVIQHGPVTLHTWNADAMENMDREEEKKSIMEWLTRVPDTYVYKLVSAERDRISSFHRHFQWFLDLLISEYWKRFLGNHFKKIEPDTN